MIIEAKNVSKRFRRHEAVCGVNLSVPKGSMFALIGANGAGKTTTLRMLVNILSPDSGATYILGVESRKLSARDFTRIGYVSESAKLPNRLTVDQYFNYVRSLYPNWDRTHEEALRKQFVLPPDRVLGKLSHGMRMKVMLAAALSFHPEVLILDEPLSGLDPLVRDEVMEGLLRQADETTIVISSHELSEIEGCATHMAFMDRGRILFQESIEDVIARFREVNVTLSESGGVSNMLPSSWLSRESCGREFRCIETAYKSDAEFEKQISSLITGIAHVEVRPISLREISKALMRATRKEQI